MLQAVSTPAIDQIAGDAAEAYPRDLGLRRFVRRLIFVKPDVLIVADDILLDKEASLELRFHPEQEAVRDGNVFLATGKRATLRLEPLVSEGIQIAGEFDATAGPGQSAENEHVHGPSEHAAIRLAKCRGPVLVGGREGAQPKWLCGRSGRNGPSRSRTAS